MNDRNNRILEKVAAYLAECHAATLESIGSKKSISKHERKRFKDICRIASDALRGEFDIHCTNHLDADMVVKHAIERCDTNSKED